ncbi:hypothetical protein GGS20DRAFT_298812 [Poronia punctata]|nr:hypothetical protein GGS20DRAFT_298812 [Poronia punctata]
MNGCIYFRPRHSRLRLCVCLYVGKTMRLTCPFQPTGEEVVEEVVVVFMCCFSFSIKRREGNGRTGCYIQTGCLPTYIPVYANVKRTLCHVFRVCSYSAIFLSPKGVIRLRIRIRRPTFLPLPSPGRAIGISCVTVLSSLFYLVSRRSTDQ